jgi:urea transport system permease protein
VLRAILLTAGLWVGIGGALLAVEALAADAAEAERPGGGPLPSLDAGPAALAADIARLGSTNPASRRAAVDEIGRSREPRVDIVLEALLDGALYQRRSDGRIVIAARAGAGARSGFAMQDAATGAELGVAANREVRRVAVDNALRGRVRSVLALRQLTSDDADARLAAVRALLVMPEAGALAPLRERLPEEPDRRVRAAIETLLALVAFESAARDVAAEPEPEAAAVLAESSELAVRERLQALVQDPAVAEPFRELARATLVRIEQRLERFRMVETLFFGLSMGSVLVLAAIGLAITFGVMGVINMAHGELIMLGAYTTYVVQLLMPEAIGWSIAVAVPAAFLVAGLVGVLIERGVIRFLYGRPLETLLATFGISLILQQAVRSVFSPLNRSVTTPDWMSGSIELLPGLAFTLNRLYILVFCLAVFALILALLKGTRLGLQIRAVAQNRSMARAMGVRSGWVDALTFGLGAGVAGVAGVALSQLTNVGPNLGQAYIVDSFLVVVFGGVGNLWGTLVAGLSLGVLNKALEPFAGAVMAKIVVLVLVVLFIQKRPRGLFPQKGRAVES